MRKMGFMQSFVLMYQVLILCILKKELKLKNGTFIIMPAKSYNLDEEDYIFRLKENITVYTKPEGRKKAFTVNKERIFISMQAYYG